MTLIHWLKSEKSKKHKSTKYYKDLDIPAKLFFNNISNEDLSFLVIEGKPSEKELKEAWENIYDLYFEKKNDRKSLQTIKIKNDISLLSYKIAVAKTIVFVLSTSFFNDKERKKIFSLLNKIKIKIDPKKDLITEIKKILTITLPSWQTRLDIFKSNLEAMNDGESYSFERMIELISDNKGYCYPENISLIRFLEAEKIVNERNSLIKKNK